MATAYTYTTAKRHNSTKVPTGGSSITVNLKGGSDLLTPTFLLNQAAAPSWSMMSFEGRYYFVTGIRNIRNDLWEVDCKVDVLATYKSNIQAMSAFVLYDTAPNNEIIDNRLPAKTTATFSQAYYTVAPALMTGQWKIAVTVTGDDSTCTYLLTPAQVKALCNSTDFNNWFNNLWSSITSTDGAITGQQSSVNSNNASLNASISGISSDILGFQALTKGFVIATDAFINAFTNTVRNSIQALAKLFRQIIATPSAASCIRSATMIPFDTVGDGTMQNIYLGEYNTSIQSMPVINPIQTGNVVVTIPWQATDWRRNAPYHQIYLYLPFVGTIQLSPSDLIGCSAITVYWAVNVISGSMSYQLSTDRNTELGTYSANIGVAIPIGASNITQMPDFGSMAAGITAAAAGNAVGAAVAAASASLNAIRPTISGTGGGGGGAASGLSRQINIMSIFHDTDVAPSNPSPVAGTPALANKSLSGLSGYVQTSGASVSGAMTDTERNEINMLLDGGIFIE